MRRFQKLELARARAKNSQAKLRNAGSRPGDAGDFDQALRHLELAVTNIDRLISKAAARSAE